MSIRRHDINAIWIAMEESLGSSTEWVAQAGTVTINDVTQATTGYETNAWKVEAILGYDTNVGFNTKAYYVLVNVTGAADPFLPVKVTVDPLGKATATQITGSAATTEATALSNIVTAVAADATIVASRPIQFGD